MKRKWEWAIGNIHENRNRKGEEEMAMANQEYERQIGEENRQQH